MKLIQWVSIGLSLWAVAASANTSTVTSYDCSMANAENNDFELKHLDFALEQNQGGYALKGLTVSAYPQTDDTSAVNAVAVNTNVQPLDDGQAITGYDAKTNRSAAIFVSPRDPGSVTSSVEVDVNDPNNSNRPLEAHLVCLTYSGNIPE